MKRFRPYNSSLKSGSTSEWIPGIKFISNTQRITRNDKWNSHKQGFTLIELLVVIAIIALLSSVVIASVRTSNEKARIAMARQFSAQNDRLISDTLVGRWDFDECSGTTSADLSGNGNTLTLNGATTWSDNTPTNIGCSLDFKGTSGQSAIVPDSDSLDLISNYTVSIWVYSRSSANGVYLIKGNNTINGIYLGYGFGGGFVAGAANVSNNPTTAPLGSDLNRWHLITTTVDGNKRSIYIDGKYLNSSSSGGNSWDNSNPLSVGGMPNGYNTNSLIDDIRIYSKVLTASEAMDNYYAYAGKYLAMK